MPAARRPRGTPRPSCSGWRARGSATIRVEPHLGDELAPEAFRRERQLEHSDRPEDGEIVESDPLRSAVCEERALLLQKQLPDGTRAGEGLADVALTQDGLHRPGADEPAGECVDLDAEALGASELGRQLAGHDRAQLDDGVAGLALDPARPRDDAVVVELEIRRVEEDDLPDLSLERIHAKSRHGGTLIRLGDCDLQLDAVGLLEGTEQLRELLARERRLVPVRRGHRPKRSATAIAARERMRG